MKQRSMHHGVQTNRHYEGRTGLAPAYDFVFITHQPSFYKVNLYEQLSRHSNVLVIFLGASSSIRTTDFVKDPVAFDHIFLSQRSIEHRPTLANLWRLWWLLRTVRPRLLLVNGWELPEFWLGVLLARCPRGLVMETTGLGVSPRGLKAAIKQLFLSCVDIVMASGEMHAAFMRRLGFQGDVFVTKGVGIINKPDETPPLTARSYAKQFLYIGRLAPEKNVDFMLTLFRLLAPDGFSLTVVGGDQSFQDGNIRHLGYLANDRVPQLFAEHDFLILPSRSEPWGLVIEESLFCGTPVVVSEACGASELVDDGVNGVLLDVGNIDAAAARLRGINAEDHERMRAHCGRAAIDAKDQRQVQRYLEALASATRQRIGA